MSDKSQSFTTSSGIWFNPFKPEPGTILINDIATGLSNAARFGGQTRKLYSVAQHSVNVSNLLLHRFDSAALAYAGLLHDASEAYIADIPRPFKQQPEFAAYRAVEGNLQREIFLTLGAVWPMHELVRWADDVLLHCEARVLLTNPCWARKEPMPDCVDCLPWDPVDARHAFITAYYDLQKALVDANMQMKRKVGLVS